MLPNNTVTDKPLPIGEVYTGVIATPGMVGRQKILAQIDKAIHDASQSYIINIVGDGGIGKTRLARHILKDYAKYEGLLVASELIDLYHPTAHIIGDLVQVIQQIVAPDGAGFENYQRERKKLLDYAIKPPEKAEELRQQRNKTIDTFLQDLNALTATRRLVLVFDTTEKLSYQEDPTARRFGAGQDQPDILGWMCHTFLPGLTNAVVIMAGRPGSGELSRLLNNIKGKQIKDIPLKGLDEDEALKYFEAVIASAAATGNPKDAEAANVLRRWTEEQRRVIFYSLHDGGERPRIRPILLALAIDHLIVAGKPLSSLTNSLVEAKNLSPAERASIQHELGRVLVQALREDARSSDEIVVTLGWLQKGADAGLLAKITRLPLETVEAALEEIKGLSFVKIRPADSRIFLHDEMYAMLMQYGQRMISGPQRQHLYDILQEHYEELIESLRDRIARLYRPKAQKSDLPSAEQVKAAQSLLQKAMVEDLHYRLRWNAQKGFDTYFRYAEEAVSSDDDDLGVLLRTELLTFLAEYDPTGKQEEVAGLKRSVIVADAAVRAVEWLWNDDKYEEALALLEELQSVIAAGDALVQAEALSWKGYLTGLSGDQQKGETLLKEATEKLKTLPQSLRRAAILARAHNNLGYLYRVQGKIYQAIDTYGQAIPLWRVTKIEAEQAATLNNRAFASAEIGSFHTARQQGEDALELRQSLGPRIPVAESMTTLGYIEIRANNLEPAERYLHSALDIYEVFDSPRRRGLALIGLAEIKRRIIRTKTYEQNSGAQFLAEGLALVEQAIDIFKNKVTEPIRLIEALYERGRIYRDWAALRLENPEILALSEHLPAGHKYSAIELINLSEQDFNEALELATKRNFKNQQIDGLLKLAWLKYRTLHLEDAAAIDRIRAELERDIFLKVNNLIPDEYCITECTGDAPAAAPSATGHNATETSNLLLVYLGRMELIRGNMDFRRWQVSRDEQFLKQAVEHFTLCLAYYERYSDHSSRPMREGTEYIYNNLKRLSTKNMILVYDTIDQVEKKYGLADSRISKFLVGRFGEADQYLSIEL